MLLFSVRTEALCRNAVYKHNVQAFHNIVGIFYFSACDVFEHIVRKNAKGGLPNGVIY